MIRAKARKGSSGAQHGGRGDEPPMRAIVGFETLAAVLRSLHRYRFGAAARRRRPAMDALYQRFVRPGDLVLDVGSHVGDRVACFRRIGARVVAVEPQPLLARLLALAFALDAGVTVERVALGALSCESQLYLNPRNLTVATLSTELVAEAPNDPAWRDQRWTHCHSVAVTTLDRLIEGYGSPHFIKIDVEGLEAQVLAGLSKPVPGLSFEFTQIQRAVALAALRRCVALGYRRFNVAIGESQHLEFGSEPSGWVNADRLARWLRDQPARVNSGDVYARL